MKKTGRLMTLRGSREITTQGTGLLGGESYEIFSYKSPDQSRGWKLVEAYCWLDMYSNLGGGDNRVGLQACLTTDVINANAGGSVAEQYKYLLQYQPSDNRTIGWSFQDYQNREDVSNDFLLIGNGAFVDASKFVHDRDRIINRELYLNAIANTEGTSTQTNINYYIVLEEIVLTDIESIMSSVKSIAQNITD
ncbi:MAG: hypothetical protein OR994_07910 [Candidatus Poseidoniales archaeon]|jgi:hypothetical protein|nr:hypothetical protein [Candidatus Poseidoniales archaeon]|tara:strand:+ start:519 stop:1097 length:579 start_codon:yes stop_codon:yes gene_type:complete